MIVERRMLPRPVRLVVSSLWLVGAALAAFTGVLALAHAKPGYAAVYGAVAAGLATLAVGTLRGVRTAELVSLVLLASQILGVVGTSWELFHLDWTSAKAQHLRDLGVNFRLAIVGNLLYSATAAAAFVWALREKRRGVLRRP